MALVALVTGGATGIGAGIAENLARAGMTVLSAGRRADILKRQEAEARKAGYSVEPVQMDATDRESIATALAKHPHIDILVNNAGLYREGHFLKATDDDLDALVAANIKSVLATSQVVVPKMPSGGRIINIASRAFLGAPQQSLYAAVKGAVIILTRCMAIDLIPNGIRVNSVSPGLVETPMTDALAPERLAGIKKMIPGGEMGTPAQIAAVVAMLASKDGVYVNGSNIIVDGGRSLGVSAGS